MKIFSLTATEFFPLLEQMDFRQGDLFLDSAIEEESFICLFYNVDSNERKLFRLPLHAKNDVLERLRKIFPTSVWPLAPFEVKDYLVPIHPLFKCDLFPKIELDGDVVQRVFFKTGYRHLGLEQHFLSKRVDQNAFFISHLNPLASPTPNILWCIAVEKLMNVDIPARAKLVRMIFLELARIRSHLHSFVSLFELLGAHIAYGMCKEKIQLLRALFGSYGLSFAHPHLATPGGLLKDMPPSWVFELKNFAKDMNFFLEYFEKEVISSYLISQRLNLGATKRHDLLRYAVSGPVIRSNGVRWDNRKKNPLYYYHELDFQVPLGTYGHAYDRLLVRFEEIKESLSLIRQICNFIPVSKIKEDFALSGNAQCYVSLEAPEGELGLYLSMGNGEIQKAKIRSCAQAHLQYFQDHSKGLSLSDFLVDYCSYHLSAEEFDR